MRWGKHVLGWAEYYAYVSGAVSVEHLFFPLDISTVPT